MAAEAARRSGMTIGEWLEAVIGDAPLDAGFEPDGVAGRRRDSRAAVRPWRDDDRDDAGLDPLDEVAARLERLARRGRETATKPASAPDDNRKVAALVDAAVSAMERTTRESERKTAAALDAVSRLIEQAEPAPDRSRRAAEEPLPSTALKQLVARLDQIDRRLVTRPAEAARDPEVPAALKALDARLGAVARQLERGAATPQPTEKALRELEQRLASLQSKLDAADGPIETGARQAGGMDRLESKLGSIMETLRQQAAERAAPARQEPTAAPRPRFDVRDLQGAVAEIAGRQRDLDQQLDSGVMVDSGSILALRDEVTVLAGRLESVAAGLRTTDLAALRDDIATLSRTTARLVQRIESDDTSGLRDDLKSISRAIENLAPRHLVDRVEASVLDLAARIEQSRDYGVRDGHLAPVERLLGDLQHSLDAIRQPESLDQLAATVDRLAERLDGLADSLDPAMIGRLQDRIEDIRQVVLRSAAPGAFDALQRQIATLGDRLDRLSEMPADQMAGAGLVDGIMQVRTLLERSNPADTLARLESRVDDLIGRLDGLESASSRVSGERDIGARVLGEIGGRIDALAHRIDTRITPRDDDALLTEIGNRIDRLQETLAARPGPTAMPASGEMEQVLRALSTRLEGSREGVDERALQALQTEIGQLARRLEKTDAGLSSIGGLEKAIAELFSRIDDVRDHASTTAERAARRAAEEALVGAAARPAGDDVAKLVHREIGDLRATQQDADRRLQSTLEVMHATLERVVDRLGTLERETSGQRPADRSIEAVPPAAVSPPDLAPAQRKPSDAVPARSPISAAIAKARTAMGGADRQPKPAEEAAPARPTPLQRVAALEMTQAARRGEGVPDLPLEPGSGRPMKDERGAFVASGASDDPKAHFIAAARRAAQAAAAQSAEAIGQAGAASGEGRGRSLSLKRKHVALLGLAALAVAGAAITVSQGGKRQEAPAPERSSGVKPAAPAAAPPDRQSQATPAPAPNGGRLSALTAPRVDAPPSREAEQPPVADPQTVGSVPGADPAPVETAGRIAADDPLARFDGLVASDRLRTAALAGDPAAQYEVGLRYGEGRGAPRDFTLAARWFERAAQQGSAVAQYRTGGLYREGRGVKADAKVALDWFRRAAEQGHVRAMHNLAVMHAEGINGAPDYAGATEWFRKAAEFGVRDSQYNLAILHARGLGTAQDLVASYVWFDAAGRQGDEDAVKKRDEVGARLSPDKLAEAKAAVQAWRAKTPNAAANEAPVPAGGWDARDPAAKGAKGKAARV